MTDPQKEITTTAQSVSSDSTSGMISVKVFRTPEDVEALRFFWSSCVGPRDSDIDIILTEQRSCADVIRPHVLGLYRGEKLDSLLIGRIVCRRLPFQVGYLNLFSPLLTIMTFPYGALRGNDNLENCEALIREVMKSLKEGEADLALLEHVKINSPLVRCGRAEAGFLLRDRFSPVRPHSRRELPNTVEELNASLSANERQRFRRLARVLATDFPGLVSFVRLGDPSDLERIMQDVEEVAMKTWQRKLGLGGFNTSAGLLAKFKTEAEIGSLRVYILYLAGKPVAFWAGAAYQKTFYSDFLGYDPDYEKYSLGTYLLLQLMEDLCSHGIRGIDFGFSDEEYKRRYRNVVWQETSIYLIPATLNGLRLGILRGITTLISNSSRAVLQRTGLMQKVKNVWRRTALRGLGYRVLALNTQTRFDQS